MDILDTAEPTVVDVNVTPLIYDFQRNDDTIVKAVVDYFFSKMDSKEKVSKFFEDIKSVFTPK